MNAKNADYGSILDDDEENVETLVISLPRSARVEDDKEHDERGESVLFSNNYQTESNDAVVSSLFPGRREKLLSRSANYPTTFF